MVRFYLASAEVHLDAGRPARALEQVARAEAFMARAGEDVSDVPEAALVRGQILFQSGCFDEAEAALLRSAALWERRQSPWELLRVATLLGRLALATGKGTVEAHDRLAHIYADFDEGFETERLQEARRVMDLLS